MRLISPNGEKKGGIRISVSLSVHIQQIHTDDLLVPVRASCNASRTSRCRPRKTEQLAARRPPWTPAHAISHFHHNTGTTAFPLTLKAQWYSCTVAKLRHTTLRPYRAPTLLVGFTINSTNFPTQH